MPSPLLLPVLTCAVVLLVSGVAKLRDPSSVERAFTSLEVPAPLSGGTVRRLVPWAEVVLGLWLLVASGVLLAVGAVLALVLFVAYLALVVRAVGRPEPVDCGCFGALGDDRVTRVTVWRNVALVVAAVLAVAGGLRGAGLLGALAVPTTWGWLATSALTALVAVLVAHRSRDDGPGHDHAPASLVSHDDHGEYVRDRIPRAQVLTEAGQVELLETQALYGAHLVVFLSPGCGPCKRVGPKVPEWAAELAPIKVKAVVTGHPDSIESDMGYLRGHVWFDHHGITREAFGVATPGAALLGTDGYLAGGPVQGEGEVYDLVDELREHLRATQDAGDPAQA